MQVTAQTGAVIAASWVEDMPRPLEIHERKSKPSLNAIHFTFGPSMLPGAAAKGAAHRTLRIQLEGGRPAEEEMQSKLNAAMQDFRERVEHCGDMLSSLLALRSVPVDPQVSPRACTPGPTHRFRMTPRCFSTGARERGGMLS